MINFKLVFGISFVLSKKTEISAEFCFRESCFNELIESF